MIKQLMSYISVQVSTYCIGSLVPRTLSAFNVATLKAESGLGTRLLYLLLCTRILYLLKDGREDKGQNSAEEEMEIT